MRHCRGSAWEHPVAIRREIPAVQSVQTVQAVSAQLGLLASYLREALGQVDIAVARVGQAMVIGRKREWQVVSIVQGENVETQSCIAVGPGVRMICRG